VGLLYPHLLRVAVPVSQEKQAEVATHLQKAFLALGLSEEKDPELEGTAQRVAQLWGDLLGGMDDPLPEINVLSSPGDQEDLVMVRDIPFVGTCAHHLTPFFGTAAIAYVPGEALIGVGVPARVVQHFTRRPQIQERLGEQVASYLSRKLDPRGVIVHLVARHICMEVRGARSPGWVETTASRGWFSEKEWRTEFFERMGARR
jgi:GTP cyclohydrolase IA